jgi:GDP-4-dehydro-6-deoxy-D-mannose reductase
MQPYFRARAQGAGVRVLVTGVTGFVGGHLVDFLRTEHPEVEVFGVERLHGTAPAARDAGVTVLQAELDDAASVEAALEAAEPDRVVHLAGQSSVQHSFMDPGGTLRTNILGFVYLMEGLGRRRRPARVLVVGSADEYGAVAPDELPIREDRPLRPRSPYAVSKAAQGLLAPQYASPELAVVITRTFPHTGPRRGEAFAESSFARQIADIEAGRRAPVLQVGNLDAVRDFTDVRDVVRAYWALLERGASGEAYNVCSGVGIRIGDLLERLVRLSNARVEVRVDPERLRPVDVPALVGDKAKLAAATGWAPRIALDETLKDLLDDWRVRSGSPASAHGGSR